MSDGSLPRSTARSKTFIDGWLEHKAHRPTGYRYERLYVLLEGNVMYIFSTDSPSQDTQVGNLTIDSNTQFIKGKGAPSKGFKFDLNTGQRLNRFRTKKSTERELWRGYVTGISTGNVPNDLDLLDSEVKIIKQDVAAFHASEEVDYDPKRSSIASGVSQRSQVSRGKDSGVVSLSGMSRQTGSSSDDSRSRRSAASTASGTVDYGGPTVVHKFYNDHNRDQKPPSWFIPRCSREMAEKVLQTALAENYGNTMMRESTSYLSNGSYVISKISVNNRDNKVEYEHFEVIRTSQGYKVNVQNEHRPMKCLQDVMDYFVDTSGGSTRPLAVNDPNVLAQDTPGYSTQILFKRPESWKWPPQDSRDEPLPVESPRQYYDNQPRSPSPDSRFRNIEGSQTVSAGILRNQRPLPSPGANERKSVGWSSVINTPPPIPDHSKTFAGSRSKPGPVPSMSELAQRSNEADQIEKFDTMLTGFESGFERSSIYVNTSSNKKKVTSPACPQPPPPPPTAHQVTQSRSYVNHNPNSGHADPVLETLPVAPPAPRDPIVSSPPSVNTRGSLAKSSSTGFSALSQSPSSTTAVNLRNSSSVASNISSNDAQKRQVVSKSLSESQLRAMRSPDSPKNFPTWETPKQKVSLQNLTKRPESVTGVNVSEKEETVAGIDDKTQGGVSSLRNRFESPSSESPAKHKAVGRAHSMSNMPIQSTPGTRQRLPVDQDDLYDDTVIEQPSQTVERKVQFQQKRQSSEQTINPVGVRNEMRRQTEPALSISKNEFEGLNQSFKNKLEGLFGGSASPGPGAGQHKGQGAPKGPGAPKGTRTLPQTPVNRQISYEDHEYQELPDMIPPDAVTYVNEKFNVDH